MGFRYGSADGATYGEATGARYGGTTETEPPTDTDELPIPKMRSHDWFVEVITPTGKQVRPTITGTVVRKPQVNGQPRIEIPVRKDEKWSRSDWDEQPVRVWYEGERQPIDRLSSVQQEPGQTILRARGGAELETRVKTEFTSIETYNAAEQLIQNNTSYTANVDKPASQIETNRLVRETETTSNWHGVTDLAADAPVKIRNNEIQLVQSAFIENADFAAGEASSSDYAGGIAATYGGSVGFTGAEYTFRVTPEYDIPANNLQVQFRYEAPVSKGPAMDFEIDGTATQTGVADGWSASPGTAFAWTGGSPDIRLEAEETYYIQLRQTQSSDNTYDQLAVDAIAVYDDRFGHTLPTGTSDGFDRIPGPEPYPDEYAVEFEPYVPSETITGARVSLTTTDNQGIAQIEFSQDGGSSYPLSKSTFSSGSSIAYEDDFGGNGGAYRSRITLQRYDGPIANSIISDGGGFGGIDNMYDYLDLDTSTVLLIDRTFDGRLVEILDIIANDANYVWEYRKTDSSQSIEWTRAGQRTASTTLDPTNYTVERSTEDVVQKANIYGGAEQIRRESFTSNYGTAVGLAQENILPQTELVHDTGDLTTSYDRGTDYEMNYQAGEITVLSGGSMSDSTTYELEYEYKPFGSASTGVSNPKEITERIPVLVSDRACENVATQIVNELQSPISSATISAPPKKIGFSLVDELTIPNLPTEHQTFQVNRVEGTAREIRIELGRARSLEDIINDIQTRISTATERT